MSNPSPAPPRFRRLTPIGRGAIAVVEVRGKNCAAIVDRVFHSAAKRPLMELPLGRIVFGEWENGEELVVCRFADDHLEVHCHGGEAAVRSVTASLTAHGCIAAVADDAFEAIRETALRLATQATTLRTAAILLNQYRGALTTAIEAIVAVLKAGQVELGAAQLRDLIQRKRVGLHLTEPFLIAIIGETNVGKSSLMNRLVGFDRSITHDEPGVTRDLVTFDSAINGWPVRFVDTAGLRESSDAIESLGIERSREQLAKADLVYLVLDARRPIEPQRRAVAADLANALIVLNKSDLADSLPAGAEECIATCAVSGAGVDQLLAESARRIADASIDWTAPSVAVPFTFNQYEILERALQRLPGDAMQAIESLKQLLA